MNIYIGNLTPEITSIDLLNAFQTFGLVTEANVIKDPETGESKCFGFIEMPDEDDAKEAIKMMNGQDFNGTFMRVSKAKPKDPRRRRFSSNTRRRQ